MTADYVKALYLDIEMQENQTWQIDVPSSDNLFVYVLEGSAEFGEGQVVNLSEKQIGLFDRGSSVIAHTGHTAIRFLLMAGKPLEEPVAWGGPIVMNTHEELEIASKELENGTFIKTHQLHL